MRQLFEKCRYMQYVAVMSGICSYMIGSWGSPSIPKLTSSDSPIGVTLNSEEVSWVASSPLLGFIVGSLTSSIPLKVIGPKWSLLSTSLPIAGCWLGIAFSRSAEVLIGLRFLSGVCDGIIATVVPLYIGEVADKDIRGKLITFYPILAGLGNLVVLAVGPFVEYKTLSFMCAAVPILFATTFVFLPESPYFLLRSGRGAESKRSLRRLLSNDVDDTTIDERIKEIEATIRSEVTHKFNVIHIFSRKQFRFAIFISFNLRAATAFGGMTVLKSYLQTIIGVTGSSISPEISSLIFAIAQQPPVILTACLVDRVGRKILLIISTLGCALMLVLEGIYFYLQRVAEIDLSAVSWLPTACLVIYSIMQPIGIGAIPNIIMGEIFADEIKSLAAGITTTFTGSCHFLLARTFLPISEAWGMHTMFWVFGVCCFYGAMFATFVLPETKGRSFLEIQETLSKSRCC
ncbi:facilitated trehalose transporter Tret1-like isoform X2 [Photinus pyralis]|uniref:facilitated trehalose transporter Tret1-like isoform X2 n=1 Tax=Photinus pyralis TaxID=7054 RepID=UPI001267256A|nr:facilitated trehalose transporter Tret1-like isoform X2 [Photinus pyralis]